MSEQRQPGVEPTPAPAPESASETAPPDPPRPMIERLGLGLIAVVLTGAFGGMATAAWIGGEVFLAVMAGIGALMTLWAAVTSLRRG